MILSSIVTEELFLPDDEMGANSSAHKTMTNLNKILLDMFAIASFCVCLVDNSCGNVRDDDEAGNEITLVLLRESVADFITKLRLWRAVGEQLVRSNSAATTNRFNDNKTKKLAKLDRFLEVSERYGKEGLFRYIILC